MTSESIYIYIPAKTQIFENSNLHGCELHRPSSKGTKLLLQVIKAIINLDIYMWQNDLSESLCQTYTYIYIYMYIYVSTEQNDFCEYRTEWLEWVCDSDITTHRMTWVSLTHNVWRDSLTCVTRLIHSSPWLEWWVSQWVRWLTVRVGHLSQSHWLDVWQTHTIWFFFFWVRVIDLMSDRLTQSDSRTHSSQGLEWMSHVTHVSESRRTLWVRL